MATKNRTSWLILQCLCTIRMHSYVLFEFYLDWWFNESQRQSMTSSSLERKKSFLTFLEHWIKEILMDINNDILLTWMIWFLLQFSFVLFFYFCCNFFEVLSNQKLWHLFHQEMNSLNCASQIWIAHHPWKRLFTQIFPFQYPWKYFVKYGLLVKSFGSISNPHFLALADDIWYPIQSRPSDYLTGFRVNPSSTLSLCHDMAASGAPNQNIHSKTPKINFCVKINLFHQNCPLSFSYPKYGILDGDSK